MKLLKWIIPAIALLAVFGFTNNYVPLTHPNNSHSYNENPAPLYKDNHKMDISNLITKKQAIEKVIKPKSAITKGAKLETWAAHVANDEPNSKFVDYQISPNRKVWVVKTYFPDGKETKVGFYKNATLISVYDAETGTLLESTVSGDYQGNPSLHHNIKK
jgi:hypothetical protein